MAMQPPLIRSGRPISRMLQQITRTLYGHPVWHANCLADFDEFVQKQRHSAYAIYRGQDRNWPLLPYISRVVPKGEVPSVENQLHRLFMDDSRPYVGKPPTNEWDWLALAQHHGLCTRLLDWTRDPYIALWFAVKQPRRRFEFSPEVWAFNPDSHHLVADKTHDSPFKVDRTRVFIAEPFHPRLEVQKAAFVVFRYLPHYAHGFCQLNTHNVLRHKLARVRFPHYVAREILKELNRRGYTQCNLFPDLDTTCKRIMRKLKKWPNKPIKCRVNPLRESTAARW